MALRKEAMRILYDLTYCVLVCLLKGEVEFWDDSASRNSPKLRNLAKVRRYNDKLLYCRDPFITVQHKTAENLVFNQNMGFIMARDHNLLIKFSLFCKEKSFSKSKFSIFPCRFISLFVLAKKNVERQIRTLPDPTQNLDFPCN